MSKGKNIDNINHVARNKKTAYAFAEKIFGIASKDFRKESGNLHATFRMSVPLYAPGLPKFLFVPLDLFFHKDSQYTRFMLMLAQPFYVNIVRSRLEKITSFSAAFLSEPECLQLVQSLEKPAADAIPEIGVIYVYGDAISSQTSNAFKSSVFKVIQHDLMVFFSMLCNHFGVSVNYMIEHAGIGCTTLALD